MKVILRSKIFQNTAWIFGGGAATAGIGFLTSLFVARKLGPSEFGELQIATAYFYIILNLENLINPHLFKKILVENIDEAPHYVRQLGRIIFSLAILLLSIQVILLFIYKSNLNLLILILTISMLFRFTNGVVFYNEINLNSKSSIIAQNSGNIISSICKVIFAELRPSVFLQVITVPIQHASSALLLLKRYRQREHNLSFFGEIDFAFLRKFVLLSLPLFSASLIELVSNRIGLLVIDNLLGKSLVGIFSAAAKISEPWTFVGAAITASFWPKTINLKTKDKNEYSRHLSMIYGILFWVSAIIAIGIFLFSDFLITNFLSTKYIESIPVLKVHIFSLFFLNWAFLTNLWEINEGLTRITLIKNSIGLLLNIFLTNFLVKSYGIIGASYATMTTLCFTSTLSCLIFPQSRHLIKIQLSSPLLGLIEFVKKINQKKSAS